MRYITPVAALAAALAATSLAAITAIAQVSVPQALTVGPNDLFPDIVGGQPTAQSQYVSSATMAGMVGTGYNQNYIIGGRADDNLWQRNTTGSSVTTTVTYGGPDRWAYWSGTNTAMTVTRVTTAAALPTGSAHAFRMQRTANQTGVVQMCMLQEISSANSYPFQGRTAELDFNVYTGANFSATSMTAYIIYGTGTDEGVAGSASVAYGLNAGGGGSGGWTGQANATAAVIPLAAVSTAYRALAVANIPTTATELAVALCYTPVGTAGTTDALYFDNIELRAKSELANFASATVGYVANASGSFSITSGGNTYYATIPAYSRRLSADEAALQYAYYYQLNDPAATVHIAPCQVITANSAVLCSVPLPPMRAAPTITAPGSHTAFAVTASDGSANVCTALAVTGSSTVLAVGGFAQVTCTPTSNIAVTVPSWLIGDATIYNINASAEF